MKDFPHSPTFSQNSVLLRTRGRWCSKYDMQNMYIPPPVPRQCHDPIQLGIRPRRAGGRRRYRRMHARLSSRSRGYRSSCSNNTKSLRQRQSRPHTPPSIHRAYRSASACFAGGGFGARRSRPQGVLYHASVRDVAQESWRLG